MKLYTLYRKVTSTLAAILAVVLPNSPLVLPVSAQSDLNWEEQAISPVANPLFSESPLIETEVRPIAVYHKISDDFIGGFARVYVVQLRYAVTERLAIIDTKDGFTQVAVGAGFRSRVAKHSDLGFAYEHGVASPKGLFDHRFTADLIVRF